MRDEKNNCMCNLDLYKCNIIYSGKDLKVRAFRWVYSVNTLLVHGNGQTQRRRLDSLTEKTDSERERERYAGKQEQSVWCFGCGEKTSRPKSKATAQLSQRKKTKKLGSQLGWFGWLVGLDGGSFTKKSW